MDIAKEILANVEAHPTQKALAQHAFEVAPHERALKGMLDRINIPLAAKADLWDAKKNASIDPKLHKMLDIANLPQDLLDKAESHPNVLKALLTDAKPSEAKSGAKGAEKAPKAPQEGNKAGSSTPAGPTSGQEEEPEVGTDPSGLPPMPPGRSDSKNNSVPEAPIHGSKSLEELLTPGTSEGAHE